MSKRVWITWENQRRNHTLSRAISAELFQLDFKTNWFVRYIKSITLTLIVFVKERPGLIFVQNPSLVLALLAVNYGRIARLPVIVDAHNAGVYPFERKKWWGNKLAAYLFRHAALTIVTNTVLAEYVKSNGGRTAVLPDPLPNFNGSTAARPLRGKYNILFICTFASDEPYMEVIEAGRLLDKDIFIYITGRYKGSIQELQKVLPENVILTGFVPEQDFIQLLHSVDVILDLTTREDCLVCGAYEAVSAEKVLIVSATKALKAYFHKGTLYTDNNSSDLAMQIRQALSNKDSLGSGIKELKKEKIAEWAIRKAEFEAVLKEL